MAASRPAGGAIFSRGLTLPFEEALLGPLGPLLHLAQKENLDLQIRENYINVYEGRGSLLKLAYHPPGRLRARVHPKYGPPPEILGVFDISDSAMWIERLFEALPGIRTLAHRHDKREGAAEFQLARANRAPPLVVLDRQVQLPRNRASRVDLVGLYSGDDGPPSIVLIELKEGISLSVKSVLAQVERYHKLYVQGGRLRSDVADSLDRVLSQKIRLGLLRPIPHVVGIGTLPVELLIVFSSRSASVIVRKTWKKPGPFMVRYLGLGAGDHVIPSRSQWETFRTSDIGTDGRLQITAG